MNNNANENKEDIMMLKKLLNAAYGAGGNNYDSQKEDIYKRQFNIYGTDYNIDLIFEETSELTKALLKARRYGMNEERRNAIIDEIADVSICIEKLIMLLGCKPEVDDRINYKLARSIVRMREKLKKETAIPNTDNINRDADNSFEKLRNELKKEEAASNTIKDNANVTRATKEFLETNRLATHCIFSRKPKTIKERKGKPFKKSLTDEDVSTYLFKAYSGKIYRYPSVDSPIGHALDNLIAEVYNTASRSTPISDLTSIHYIFGHESDEEEKR